MSQQLIEFMAGLQKQCDLRSRSFQVLPGPRPVTMSFSVKLGLKRRAYSSAIACPAFAGLSLMRCLNKSNSSAPGIFFKLSNLVFWRLVKGLSAFFVSINTGNH